ncbi:MAG: acyl-CoA dehydrogenase family protein [Myxococcota bacterium]
MVNFYQDNADLRFQIAHIDWSNLLQTIPDAFRVNDAQQLKQQANELLEPMGQLIGEKIAPLKQQLDEQHPQLQPDGEVRQAPAMQQAMQQLQQMGAASLSAPVRVGGMGMPHTLSCALYDMLARADLCVVTQYMFGNVACEVLQHLALREGSCVAKNGQLQATPFDDIMRGTALQGEVSAMALTEPNAGSDLSQIRTKATKQKDNSWRVSGQKIWITCGHAQHHLVLARTEDGAKYPGLQGLSLLYVPSHIKKRGRQSRNITIAGFDKKMGQHGLVTATIDYDNSWAQLVGQRQQGFQNMLLLMNRARVFAGIEGLGACEAAYRIALEHAQQRVTMGKPIVQHEMIADYLACMQTRIYALRALAFAACFAEEKSYLLQLLPQLQPTRSSKQQQDRQAQLQQWQWRARMLAPLTKYMGSELAVYVCRMAMQILGGVGYMKEYKVQRWLRDSLILPIYEGTSQIQALMVLKDHLQRSMQHWFDFLRQLSRAKWQAVAGRNHLDRQLAKLQCTYFAALQTLLTQIAANKVGQLTSHSPQQWQQILAAGFDPKTDFAFGLLHAERFCQIAADVAAAEILVQQAHDTKGQPHGAWREQIAQQFCYIALPNCRSLLQHICANKQSPQQRLQALRPDFGRDTNSPAPM